MASIAKQVRLNERDMERFEELKAFYVQLMGGDEEARDIVTDSYVLRNAIREARYYLLGGDKEQKRAGI